MTYLGIEIGGTKLQLGLGAGDGIITRLARRDVQPAHGAEGVRAQIVEAFRSLETPVDAVGVGFGGPIDADRGIVTTSNQVGGWSGFPLREWVQEVCGTDRVVVQNDADTAALGEARFGAGRGLSPILYVNSGSGIGGGLIVDGKIYRGSGVGAIEIGHLWMREDDGYEEAKTLEGIASGWAIGSRGREWAERHKRDGWESDGLLRFARGEPENVTAQVVAKAARAEPYGVAAMILRAATTAMGRALAHAITLLAPKRVILGGGVSLMGDDLWLEPIREVVEARVFPPFRGTFDMVLASLGEDVVVLGAIALAADSTR